MVKKKITKEEFLMLEGLLVLRNEANKQHNYIEKAIGDLLGEEGDESGYYGLITDYMWEETGAKQLLKNLDIKFNNNQKGGK